MSSRYFYTDSNGKMQKYVYCSLCSKGPYKESHEGKFFTRTSQIVHCASCVTGLGLRVYLDPGDEVYTPEPIINSKPLEVKKPKLVKIPSVVKKHKILVETLKDVPKESLAPVAEKKPELIYKEVKPVQEPEKIPEKIPVQEPEEIPEKKPVQEPERIPIQEPERVPEQIYERASSTDIEPVPKVEESLKQSSIERENLFSNLDKKLASLLRKIPDNFFKEESLTLKDICGTDYEGKWTVYHVIGNNGAVLKSVTNNFLKAIHNIYRCKGSSLLRKNAKPINLVSFKNFNSKDEASEALDLLKAS